MRQTLLTATFFVILTGVTTAQASDFEREQRLIEEVEANLFSGELVRLEAAGVGFAAVEMASETDSTRGAVILLHGRGLHADWPENIGPLRVGLSEAGWLTLSLQMPVLEKSAKYFDYVPILPEALPRIDAGIAHVAGQGISPVILLAHSGGAHMALRWLEEHADTGIDAFIGIGMGATDYQQPMQHPFPFARLKIPILDLYGEDDYPAVRRMAPERLTLIEEGGNRASSQRIAPGAGHYFTGQADLLLQEVGAWLGSLGY